jgi:hypothetical protein
MKAADDRRVLRAVVVIAVNGALAAYQIATINHGRAMDRLDPVRHFQAQPTSFSEILWFAPLLLGLVLEIPAPRAARIVNVGYYVGVAVLCIVATVLASLHLFGFGEPEHVVLGLLFIGCPAGVFAIILSRLYRGVGGAAAPQTSAA